MLILAMVDYRTNQNLFLHPPSLLLHLLKLFILTEARSATAFSIIMTFVLLKGINQERIGNQLRMIRKS